MSGHGSGGRGGHGGGRARRGGHEEEHVNHERWLVSYSDMITVLMALFIVLFAISQVDQDKYVALRDSLAAGFGDGTAAVLDGTSGALDGEAIAARTSAATGTAGIVDVDSGLGEQAANPMAAPGSSSSLLEAARVEAAHLTEIEDVIGERLAAAGLSDLVRMRLDERGLVVGLVADDVFFANGSAELTPAARAVLDATAPALRAAAESVAVEGHANRLPAGGRYATNWELSADRAVRVVRHLVESAGLPADRITATGFGDARPLVDGETEAALAANRRVDLVILSNAPDEVRALLPAMTGQE